MAQVSACQCRRHGSIPGLGRSPGEGNGNLLQYSCLGNSMLRGAWWAVVHGVTKESHMTGQLNSNNNQQAEGPEGVVRSRRMERKVLTVEKGFSQAPHLLGGGTGRVITIQPASLLLIWKFQIISLKVTFL